MTDWWLIARVGVLVALMLTGCAQYVQHNLRWDKPGATEQQFMTDRYQCLQEAREQRASGYADASGAQYGSRAVVNMSMFQACLTARGYARNDASGQFGPPPGGTVPMR